MAKVVRKGKVVTIAGKVVKAGKAGSAIKVVILSNVVKVSKR